jgi:tRNA-Thr(GGU) m(6)t(6)A37 methyltransferase TsaA
VSKEREQTTFEVKPVGWIRTDFKQKFGTPRQATLASSSRAHVELAAEYVGRGIFQGLESFSHVWVVSYMHLSESKKRSVKVRPPRLGGAKVGVMGSRSPDRPNNIGLTLSRIISCEGDNLQLAEIDLVDGTPILDLKPYLPQADRPEIFSAGWTAQVPPRERICDFSEKADRDLQELVTNEKVQEPSRVRALILEMLQLDPRAPAYLGRKDAMFAVWVAGLNVRFRFHEEKFTVTDIEST